MRLRKGRFTYWPVELERIASEEEIRRGRQGLPIIPPAPAQHRLHITGGLSITRMLPPHLRREDK